MREGNGLLSSTNSGQYTCKVEEVQSMIKRTARIPFPSMSVARVV